MLGQLIPLGKGEVIPLSKERLLVGSHRLCDIVIHSTSVAPVHCQLLLRDFWWQIRNLTTDQETKVNGLGVTEQRLEPGDILWVGAHHKYEIRYDRDALTSYMIERRKEK